MFFLFSAYRVPTRITQIQEAETREDQVVRGTPITSSEAPATGTQEKAHRIVLVWGGATSTALTREMVQVL